MAPDNEEDDIGDAERAVGQPADNARFGERITADETIAAGIAAGNATFETDPPT